MRHLPFSLTETPLHLRESKRGREKGRERGCESDLKLKQWILYIPRTLNCSLRLICVSLMWYPLGDGAITCGTRLYSYRCSSLAITTPAQLIKYQATAYEHQIRGLMHVYSLVVVPEFQPDQLIAISKCLFLFHMNIMIIIVLEFILRGPSPLAKRPGHIHM